MSALRWRHRPTCPQMAHPVTLDAKLHQRFPEVRPTACRCPGGPCRVHPFAFDMESLLSPRPRDG